MECSTRSKAGIFRASRSIGWLIVLLTVGISVPAWAGDSPTASERATDTLSDWLTPERVSGTCGTVLLFSALSLAPALVLMTTSFVRVSIVLALIRQAMGTAAVPSNQVLAGLALFMTAAIMAPVWQEIHQNAIQPYQATELPWEAALEQAKIPLHRFMARQIERTGNADDVWLFLDYSGVDAAQIASYDEVPFHVLAPAFLLSELKTAFLIG